MSKSMQKTKTPRELAYEALLAVERDGMQSHLVMQEMLQNMDSGSRSGKAGAGTPEREREKARDRAFIMRLVEGTIEYRLQLDYVIDQFSKTKTAKMRPGIREILRMAVYQILYMDSVPDRAAVNEAVSLAIHKGFSGLRGFVNGVLRTISREKENLKWPDKKTDTVRAVSVRYSLSEEIAAAWISRYGEEKTEDICRAFLEDRPLTGHWFGKTLSETASENSAQETEKEAGNSAQETKQEAEKTDCLTPTGIVGNSFFIRKGTDPAELPSFREGKLYIQDLSSQIAVAAADIQPGDRVLDLCAAPGGKSLLAAGYGAGVLARDLTEEKTALIRENAERLGLLMSSEIQDVPEEPGAEGERKGAGDKKKLAGVRVETADAAVFDPALEHAFDVVIADLPCSGFGVAGRKPEIKYKSYQASVGPLAELQKKILANAVRYVRPGGKLLYSTCTIAEEENEANVRWLLERYGELFGLRRTALSKPVRELLAARSVPVGECGVQLLPCDGPWDGFFFALLGTVTK